ncbi:MAG: hypothetical protein Q4F24_08430 [Eubacteriales bacterium]|nr:hypothetical protein [Eubacteriales bacterium]
MAATKDMTTGAPAKLLFVMGFHLGIAGAAATLIAQGISCIYCFVVLRRVN